MNKREVIGAIGYYSKSSIKYVKFALYLGLFSSIIYLAGVEVIQRVSSSLDTFSVNRVTERSLVQPTVVEKQVTVPDSSYSAEVDSLRKEIERLK